MYYTVHNSRDARIVKETFKDLLYLLVKQQT